MKYILHPHHVKRIQYHGSSWTDSFDVHTEDGEIIYYLDYVNHGLKSEDYSIKGKNGKEIGLFRRKVLSLSDTHEIYRMGQFYAKLSHKNPEAPIYTMNEKGLTMKTSYLKNDFYMDEFTICHGETPIAYLKWKSMPEGTYKKHGNCTEYSVSFKNGYSDDPDFNNFYIETNPENLFDVVMFVLAVFEHTFAYTSPYENN